MAELFGQTKQNISPHIKNCYNEKELIQKATVKDSLTVQKGVNCKRFELVRDTYKFNKMEEDR